MANAQEIEELKKLALVNVEELESATATNKELSGRVSKLAHVVDEQQKLIEAFRYAVDLVKTGEIDASQLDEEIDRIVSIGLDHYKQASLAPDAIDHRFGDTVEENVSRDVEKVKVAHTLDGKPLTSIEALMLEWRETRKGIPAGVVYDE